MQRFKGGGPLPPKATLLQLSKGLIGGFLGILSLSLLSQYTTIPWLMAPFGATCVLLFAVPSSPLAQPRNVILGHLITASVGLVVLYGLGNSSVMIGLAVGLGIMLMQFFRAVHPPAGANPIVIILAGKSAVNINFLLTPVLIGSITLVLIAIFVNNIGGKNPWPIYWHGFSNRKI